MYECNSDSMRTDKLHIFTKHVAYLFSFLFEPKQLDVHVPDQSEFRPENPCFYTAIALQIKI